MKAVLTGCFFMLAVVFSYGQGVTYAPQGKGGYTFSKKFKTIKDIPRFSEWDSLPDGKWFQYYESGELAAEYIMKHHLLNGPAIVYFPGGGHRFDFHMYGNYIHGDFKEYYPSGKVFKHYRYNEGFMNGQWTIYYESGQVKATGHARDDKQVGKLYHYYENGNMKEERTYVDDKVDGINIFWYEHGKKMMEGNMLGTDTKVGKWTYWYEDGQKSREVEYKNNLEYVWNAWDRKGVQIIKDGNGKYISKALNGRKLIEGQYVNGMQEGRWFYWDEKLPETTPPKIIYYSNGIKQ